MQGPGDGATADPAAEDAPQAPAPGATVWEQRSADRVLRGARDRVLARSRRFVQAGAELVAEQGIDGLTLRALLERTGLSRRAFYERFESKDELLLAVFEQSIRRAAEIYAARIAPIDDPLERVRFIVRSMISAAHADAALQHSMAMSREHLRLAESRPAELRHALEPLDALIARELAAGIERGQVRAADPRELAVMIHNLVAATLHTALLAGPRGSGASRSSAEMADAVWEFCRRAVCA